MATKKPRINVTLEPYRYQLLKRLAELQGVSMSYLLADLLDSVAPVLERVAVAIEAAQQAQESLKPNLVRVAQQAEAELSPMLSEAITQLDMFIRQAQSAPSNDGGAPARGEAPAVEGADSLGEPPSSNTGVRSVKSRGIRHAL